MTTASIFQNGSSQAVRIPKKYRFQSDRVEVRKIGNLLVLAPVTDSWDSLINSLDHFSSDFMTERNQPEIQDREGLFE